MAKVRPSLSMMRRQEFIARLKERSKELRRAIELYDQVIWPVIIQGNDSMLKDGYCRHHSQDDGGKENSRIRWTLDVSNLQFGRSVGQVMPWSQLDTESVVSKLEF